MGKIEIDAGLSDIILVDGQDAPDYLYVAFREDKDAEAGLKGGEWGTHLDRGTVRELLPYLQRFAETGSLEEPVKVPDKLRCGTCNGTGGKSHMEKDCKIIDDPCPDCGGSGEVDKPKCERCGDTGTILVGYGIRSLGDDKYAPEETKEEPCPNCGSVEEARIKTCDRLEKLWMVCTKIGMEVWNVTPSKIRELAERMDAIEELEEITAKKVEDDASTLYALKKRVEAHEVRVQEMESAITGLRGRDALTEGRHILIRGQLDSLKTAIETLQSKREAPKSPAEVPEATRGAPLRAESTDTTSKP